jgi:chitinase
MCDTWTPAQLDPSMWTHLYYSFALISDDFQMATMNDYDTTYYSQFTGLKERNPGL